MTDLTLFDLEAPELEPIDVAPTASAAERFAAFHRANPHVADQLEAMTARLVARGRARVGIKMLVEVLRWHYQLTTDDPTSDYKINNDYTAYLARLLVERHPEWDGVFEMRRSAADQARVTPVG